MAKTKQQGYYRLKSADKWLHFSMNCWINLQRDSGLNLNMLGEEFDKADQIGQFALLSDIAFAALKAYDQEEGNDIDYDIYKVREWVQGMDDAQGFWEAMTAANKGPEGKKKAKK